MLSDDVMGFLLSKSQCVMFSRKDQEKCINQLPHSPNNYMMSFFCVALVIRQSLFEY